MERTEDSNPDLNSMRQGPVSAREIAHKKEVQPCRKCGGRAALFLDSGCNIQDYYVKCTQCGEMGEVANTCGYAWQISPLSPKKLIKRWNKKNRPKEDDAQV